MKKNKKTLFDLVKHYQNTEELLPGVYEYQINFLLDNMQEFFDVYVKEHDSITGSFSEFITYQLDDWMINNGFSRDMDIEFDDDYCVFDEIEEGDEGSGLH